MRVLSVNTKDKYNVIIGNIDDELTSLGDKYSKILVVSDSNLEKLYLNEFVGKIKGNVSTFVFEAGEERKCIETYENVLNKLIENNFTRNDLIVAFGGGVVGDVVGFVASTYQRGVDFINVPTTLLSMIDSSVGGKCGINFSGRKNYVGSFYQPKAVLIDPIYLDTLSIEERQNGIGEGIKYLALIGNTLQLPNVMNLDDVEDFIYDCLAYKSKIVEMDERDSFERKLLNLGHTIGHAIEEESNFEISHGVAVANGVYFMAKASNMAHRLSDESFAIIEDAIKKNGIPECYFESCEEIKKYILKDKKMASDSDIDVVIISELGECDLTRMEVDSFVAYISQSAVYKQIV